MVSTNTPNTTNPLIAPTIQPFQNYLPNAFDDNLTLLQKLNALLNYMNTVTDTVNSAVSTVSDLSSTINTDVDNQLNTWKDDGTLSGLIGTSVSDLSQKTLQGLTPEKYGAKGDGVTDDTSAIQSMFNAITSPTVVIFGYGKTYKITDTLTINTDFTTILGYGAKLDASAFVGSNVFNFIAMQSTPYNSSQNRISGFEVVGNGKTGTLQLFNFNNTSSSLLETAHLLFADLSLHDFGTGIFIGKDAYILNFDHCNFYNMGTIISAPSGYTNSGERITFNKCTLFNSNLVLSANNYGDFYFNNCSLDYCLTFMNFGGARVFCQGCHFEYGNGTESTSSNMITNTSGQSVLMLSNCYILGATTMNSTLEFINVADGSIVAIDNCFTANISGNRLVKANGNARVSITGLSGDGYAKHYLPSEQLSVLSDPSFEKSWALSQLVTTVAGSSTITLDTSTKYSGNQSLKLYKPNSTATETCQVKFTVPMKASQRLYLDMMTYYSVAQGTASTDAIHVLASYLDKDGNALQNYEHYFSGTQESAFSLQSFTEINNSQAPKGTTQVQIVIELHGLATGTLWIDSLYVNVV